MKSKRVDKAQVEPVVMSKNRKIESAIKLLKENGYGITEPPKETEYQKAIRTGIKPAIWPPIVMTKDELEDFRKRVLT